MESYTLLLLHKLEESFGYYDVESGRMISKIKTKPFPHEICLDKLRSKIYIAEMGVRGIESEGPGGHTISVFDVKTGKQISTIDTGIYDRPHGIVATYDNLLVTSESTKRLLVYDLFTEKLINAIYLGQDCAHMVNASPDCKIAFTANILSNTITAVDLQNFEVVRHIKVPERPEGLVFSPDSERIYCVCREAETVVIIDARTFEIIERIRTESGPVRIAISKTGNSICIPLFHSSAVQFADTITNKVTDTIKLGPHPAGVCVSPDGKVVFISCEEENIVYALNFETHELISKIKTGEGADAMVCLFAKETVKNRSLEIQI